ncbi:Kinesin-like protein kifc1 [Mortierella alpina]|uniref:Kinesin-like protein kifc1 n=1 Tax=Mortierella alpina TaxID=64518 RepID=A0A9P6M6C4_MORAP|nr:Kinesin-like protein kifc1 [Mortierella alpina]
MENKSAPAEPLNRSVSKLKPPSTITRSNSSSALSTALAVAAAAQNDPEPFTRILGNSINGNKNKDNTLTLEMLEPLPAQTVAGRKRKAEESIQSQAAERRPLTNRVMASARMTSACKPAQQPPKPARATARAPLQTQPQQTARDTAARQTPSARVTAARGPPAAASAPRGSKPSTVRPRPTPVVKSAARATTSSNTAPAGTGGDTGTEATDIRTKFNLPQKKKRAAWDVKGRLQDMEELTNAMRQLQDKYTVKLSGMTTKLDAYTAQILELESAQQDLENAATDKDTERMEIIRKKKTIDRELNIVEGKHAEEIRSLQSKQAVEKKQVQSVLAKLQQEQDTVRLELQQTSSQLEQQQQECTTLRSTILTQSSICLAFESDNRALKLSIERTEDIVSRRGSSIEALQKQVSSSQTLAQELQQKISEEELARRKLHGIILDLKSTVRVFCRVRPATTAEAAAMASIQYPDLEGKEILLANGLDLEANGQPRKLLPFTFDKIFQSSSTQKDIYEDFSGLIQASLNGSSTTILAYGQSRSGKTYTMEGPLDTSEDTMGLIPRGMLQLLQSVKEMEPRGWSHTIEVQCLEIHSENIYDLLSPEGTHTNKVQEVRHATGKTALTGLTSVSISSAGSIATVLRTAAKRRSVATEPSSDKDSQTGSKESAALCQQGLKALIEVFGTITNKDPQIPFRSSKPSFGNNSKMAMIVHISPARDHFEESIRSLRFATKVNSCVIGAAASKRVKGN